MLQLIEGRAPKKATLQQACDIFAVLEYCLADSLLEIIPNYLEPLMEELSAREVRCWQADLWVEMYPLVVLPSMHRTCCGISFEYQEKQTVCMITSFIALTDVHPRADCRSLFPPQPT
jgi:hypothetical protein